MEIIDGNFITPNEASIHSMFMKKGIENDQ